MTREYYSKEKWKEFPFNWGEFHEWAMEQDNNKPKDKTDGKYPSPSLAL